MSFPTPKHHHHKKIYIFEPHKVFPLYFAFYFPLSLKGFTFRTQKCSYFITKGYIKMFLDIKRPISLAVFG